MSKKRFFVINSGSSSLKYAVFEAHEGEIVEVESHNLEVTPDNFADKLKGALESVGHVDAVGHRVVHGGRHYTQSVRIDDKVYSDLKDIIPLAPLHQPHNLHAMEILREASPDLPQVACFDTAFHRTQPRLNQIFAIPRELTDEGVLRYGFHGLSYAYIASSLPRYTDKANGKVVCLHIGSGASACAIEEGKSKATTMGFTALDGLMMGTRCGNIDPGVLLYLMQNHKMDGAEIEQLLYKKSGLLGVSGGYSDMRDLLSSSEDACKEAVELFCLYAVKAVGSLVAQMQGIDVLVFTAGVGENSDVIRAKICEQLGWLGVDMDATANKDRVSNIHSAKSKVDICVVPTNEELMIAQDMLKVL